MRTENLEMDIHYLKQMIYWANKVQVRLSEVKKYGISLSDEMVIDSLAINIGQIGEQLDSQKISEQTKRKYMSDRYWLEVKKFRNKMYHHYGSRDNREILDIALHDMDEIIEKVNQIILKLQKEL